MTLPLRDRRLRSKIQLRQHYAAGNPTLSLKEDLISAWPRLEEIFLTAQANRPSITRLNQPNSQAFPSPWHSLSSATEPKQTESNAALAQKGQAIANRDPLTFVLRNLHPEGPVRRGFDIGMAAAEHDTELGPGKQRIHDSLLRQNNKDSQLPSPSYSRETKTQSLLLSERPSLSQMSVSIEHAPETRIPSTNLDSI
jgi:hypothetical protein